MPCESEIMDTSETSNPELENSAITRTTQLTSKTDENICLDSNGSPYMSGSVIHPSLMLPNLPSSGSPYGNVPTRGNASYPVAVDGYPSSASSTIASPSPASSSSHLEPPSGSSSANSFSSAASHHPFSGTGGAFRSVSAPNGSNQQLDHARTNGFHGSAFAPARSSLQNPKIEPGLVESPIHSSPQGGPPTLLQHIKHEDIHRLDDLTPDPCNSERVTPEENGRTLRKVKKRAYSENLAPCCPVCGVTVRPSELPAHFHHEVCRLEKVAKSVQRPSRENTPSASPSGSRRKDLAGSEPSINTPESRWEVYEKIKTNRNSRLTARANRGKKKEETTCPVCSEKVSGTPEELNNHVELCLKKRKESSSDEEPVDVEGDENFEEYDWGGETRIRATSLVQGGLSTLGFQSMKKNTTEDDDDVDLNVDGDDTLTFGQAQYSEVDVIPCRTDVPSEDKAREELRQAVLRNNDSSTTCNNSGVNSKWNSNKEESNETLDNKDGENSEKNGDSNQIISSLKQRISELEAPNTGKLKCLICMEIYSKPVVSISCWHVHCEECWLRTLGVKKLCPQCNTITSPTDLRVVFL